MIKKAFLLFILIITMSYIPALAQTPGTWRQIQMSGLDIDRVLDTPHYVYYLTGDVLYSYDKDNNETIYYAPGTKISDNGVKYIKYNEKGKYLVCVYKNSNIDLIYDDGRIVNLPEIKDSKINGDKTVNEVNFGDGRLYVATVFGIVVYDDKDHMVLESGIYNKNVAKIGEFGDYVVIFCDYYLQYSPKSERHNTLDKFKKVWNVGIDSWIPVNDNSYLTIFRDGLYYAKFDIATENIDIKYLEPSVGAKTIESTKDGYFCVTSDNKILMIDKDGNVMETVNVPEQLQNHEFGMYNSVKSVWAADKEGIGNYDISSGALTVLSDKFMPVSSKQFNTAYACYTPDGNEVYFNGIGNTNFHPSGDYDSGISIPLLLESYNWATGDITPMYPYMENQLSTVSQNIQNETHQNILYGGPGQTIVDPVDPSFVYHANNFEGLIVLKDGEFFYRYNESNSPLQSHWGARIYGLKFDKNGNLWVVHWGNVNHNGVSSLKVISKESLALMRQNPESIEEKNGREYKHWQTPKWVENSSGWTDGKITFSGNYALYIDAEYDGPIVGIDTKGTTTVSDDKIVRFSTVRDQDGNVNNLYTKTSLITDKNDNIWIGTDMGIFILKDARNLVDESSTSLTMTRPKVPRNDGTIYADYLLSTDYILSIAVDPTNRKWIGTKNSGLFLVNEDGTEILEEWNKDNSPLISNTITMVACDPKGNDVLIGTPEGIFVYSSNASPAADSYEDIYAYPNPVRPDYTGLITIKGLMEDSLVKIADVQGHVVWNGRSEGGLAVWDGCDSTGNRVHSGVYMVYVSQNATGSSSGAVTKIVVIN